MAAGYPKSSNGPAVWYILTVERSSRLGVFCEKVGLKKLVPASFLIKVAGPQAWTETYSESSQTSVLEVFCQNK